MLFLRLNSKTPFGENSGRGRSLAFGLLRIAELLLVVLLLTKALPAYSAEPGSDFAKTDCDTIALYAAELEGDLIELQYLFDLNRAASTAKCDSLELDIKVLGWEMDYLKDNQRKWYQYPPLWFLVGAVSATFVMGSAMQITF